MQRPGVEVVAFDEDDWSNRLVADLPHLSPEAPAAKRAMKVGDGLSLDHDSAADPIVAGGERFDRDACTEPLKSRRYAAPSLEYVRHDHGDGVGAPRGLIPHGLYSIVTTGRHTVPTPRLSLLGIQLAAPIARVAERQAVARPCAHLRRIVAASVRPYPTSPAARVPSDSRVP